MTNDEKSVLVIGGSGFLGSHVADRLTEAGYDVRIFDGKHSPWLRPQQQMIVGDLLDEEAVRRASERVKAVFHFAALADLNDALRRPLDTVRINILGTVNVLEACRVNAVKRLVYASTVYVYSREGGFYRCSKQAAESYVEEYQRTFGLEYTILRYGSLYGPRADMSNGLHRIVRSALLNQKLRYEGHRDAIREYIHVDDAARATVRALDEEFLNASVTLTGHEPIRVHDLIMMVGEILGLSGAVEFHDKHEEGHYVRTPYAYLPKLGRKYVPPMHVDLGQGLLQLVDEIRGSIDAEKKDTRP
jgi:UDP-glucose 4-epimerase